MASWSDNEPAVFVDRRRDPSRPCVLEEPQEHRVTGAARRGALTRPGGPHAERRLRGRFLRLLERTRAFTTVGCEPQPVESDPLGFPTPDADGSPVAPDNTTNPERGL
jgi:hypothetical protein